MTTKRQPLAPLHHLLRHTGQNELTVTVAQHGDYAAVRANDTAGDYLLRTWQGPQVIATLLAHYPVPVTINGAILPRSAFPSQPAAVISAYPNGTVCGQPTLHQRGVAGLAQQGGAYYCEGLTYRIAAAPSSHFICGSMPPPLTSPALRTVAIIDPTENHDHYQRVNFLTVHYNLPLPTRPQELYLDYTDLPTGVASATSETAPAGDAVLDRTRATQLAEALNVAGGIPLPADHRLHQAWHQPGSVPRWIALPPRACPVRLSDAIPAQLSYSLATALYAQNHRGLVPVSAAVPDQTDLPVIGAITISVVGDTGMRQLEPEAPPAEYPHFSRVRAIRLELTAAESGCPLPTRAVPAPCAFLGWPGDEVVIGAPDWQPTVPELTVDLVNAYWPWFDPPENETVDEYEDYATVLATRIVLGESAGFHHELQRLANRFEPQSVAAPLPLTVTTDRHRITWSPTDFPDGYPILLARLRHQYPDLDPHALVQVSSAAQDEWKNTGLDAAIDRVITAAYHRWRQSNRGT